MNKLVTTSAALFLALAFQAQAAEPKEEKTASGIGITMLKEGTGANPKASDTVKLANPRSTYFCTCASTMPLTFSQNSCTSADRSR
jgi:hypothetical protein